MYNGKSVCEKTHWGRCPHGDERYGMKRWEGIKGKIWQGIKGVLHGKAGSY